MKQFLLPGLAAIMSLSGMAADIQTPLSATSFQQAKAMKAEKSVSLLNKSAVLKRTKLSPKAELQLCRAENGRTFKRIVTTTANGINAQAKTPAKAATSDDTVLFEDFEGFEGQLPGWLPEGFSVRSQSDREEALGWGVADPATLFVGNSDGYAAFISFDQEFLDEWLVCPQVHVGQDMSLSFMACADPVYFFSMENVDWDTYEYIGDKILAAELQIMASTDGGQTWELVKALSEDYLDWDFESLLMASTSSLEKMSFSLADYADKDVTLAFRYVGTDGNSMAIDDIMVGKTPLEVSYINPLGSLYYGLSVDALNLNLSLNVGPSCAPVSWLNSSENTEADFTWSYFAHDNEWRNSSDFDLTETYYPDYTSEFTTRNNLYYTPILSGVAPGFSEGAFSRSDYYQAGGKADFEITDPDTNEKVITNFGLSPVDVATEDFTSVTDAQVPIFGYDPNADAYWTNYTFQGEDDENNWVKMESIIDVFFATDAPMVIDGLWVSGYSRIKDGASFTAEICPLDDEGHVLDPIATAVASRADISDIDFGGAVNFSSIAFSFPTPVVMSTEVCDQYIIRISGFNDAEHVEYFSPFISGTPNVDGFCFGYIEKTICFEGEARKSLTALANYLGAGYSFLFNLDAYFPWLSGEGEHSVTAGTTSTYALDSYHPGENLTVEDCPEWLEAKVSGRYGDTLVEFTAAPDANGSADVTVKGHGVSHKVSVKAEANGIAGINAETAGAEAVYSLDGVRVSDSSAPGLYIVKTAAGKVEKRIIR